MISIIIKCDKCGKDLVCSDYTMTFLGEIIVMVNIDCVCGNEHTDVDECVKITDLIT